MGLFELPMEVAGKDLELRKRLERKPQVQNRCCFPIRNNARLESIKYRGLKIIMKILLVESRAGCNAYVDVSRELDRMTINAVQEVLQRSREASSVHPLGTWYTRRCDLSVLVSGGKIQDIPTYACRVHPYACAAP
jgi:hypothetical protein